MNRHHQTLIVAELHRLESKGYVGLLGTKYLTPSLTIPDKDGNRVTFINMNPKAGWAIVAFGPPDEEVKHKFLKDLARGWVYDGLEKAEVVH